VFLNGAMVAEKLSQLNATLASPGAVHVCMQVSGSSSTGLVYDVAVAKKVQQATQEQGKQALELIASATPPPSNASGDVGGRLNIVA
jgi:hypothetical protein